MTKDVDPEELVSNADKLRELIKEAHVAIQDLKSVAREAKAAHEKALANLQQIRDVAVEEVDKRVAAILGKSINDATLALGPELKKVQDAATNIILEQFDSLFQLLMNGQTDNPLNDVRILSGMDPKEMLHKVDKEAIMATMRGEYIPVYMSHGKGLPNFAQQKERIEKAAQIEGDEP